MTLLSLNSMKTNIGQYSVLHDISINVPEGGVFVLLGRNDWLEGRTFELPLST